GEDSHGGLERDHAERRFREGCIARSREPPVFQAGPTSETLHAIRAGRPERDSDAPLLVPCRSEVRGAIPGETQAVVPPPGDPGDEAPFELARGEHLPLSAGGPVDPILAAGRGDDREPPPVAEVGRKRTPRPAAGRAVAGRVLSAHA